MGVFLTLIAVLLSACGGGEPTVSFKPHLLPVKFSWNSTDPSRILISGDTSMVTLIGIFSIGAQYSIPNRDSGTIYIIIRDRREGVSGFDRIYRVESGSGELAAVVNGTTTIQVINRQVLIDVTDGNIETIQLKEAQPVAAENSSSIGRRWVDYSSSFFYSPFSLTRWAYDDSTISSWYGLGFAWFLVRLAAAIILLFVGDMPLTVLFVITGASYLLFGPTGRNIIIGLSALFFALTMIAALWRAWGRYYWHWPYRRSYRRSYRRY